jgi:aspartate aminotransferase-like enzyme
MEWSIDGLASCSQKGLLAPPGLSVVYLSERAWEKAGRTICTSYFFDLPLHRKLLQKRRPQNPFTPPVSTFYSLAASLRYLEDYGYRSWFARTRRSARSFEAACEQMGLKLFIRKKFPFPRHDRSGDSVRKGRPHEAGTGRDWDHRCPGSGNNSAPFG